MIINMDTIDIDYKEGLPKRLSLAGQPNMEYKSYLIPIGYLYYNNLNGRNSSYSREYDQSHDVSIEELFETDRDAYNREFARFVVDSADDGGKSYKKTREDIRKNGQKIPGVILSDGRVIDGNRRFTALRELYHETGDQRFGYFECVVLKTPAEDDAFGWKQIKLLELNLQFNEDDKKDYNPVEKVVSLYLACMGPDKICEPKEYMNSTGMTKSEFETLQRCAEIMVDYLHWLGHDDDFYIIRNKQLDGPIKDIASALRGKDTSWFFNGDIRDSVYEYLTLIEKRSQDRTREIRALIKSARDGTALYDVYKEKLYGNPEVSKQIGQAVRMKDSAPSSVEDSGQRQQVIAEAASSIVKAFDDGQYAEKKESKATEPIDLLSNAIDSLKKIKVSDVQSFPDPRKVVWDNKLTEIEDLIKEIKNGTR